MTATPIRQTVSATVSSRASVTAAVPPILSPLWRAQNHP
jgi:hypothetical protein